MRRLADAGAVWHIWLPDEGERMIRKDIALDSDRPHFYSQYWVEVAMGKHEGSAASTAEMDIEPDDEALELEEPPEIVTPKAARPSRAKSESKKPEQPRAAVTSLQDLAQMMKTSAEMDADTVPDIDSAVSAPETLQDVIVTDFDPATLADVEEPASDAEPEFSDEEFEDEDEWGNDGDQPRRGSKPAKRQRREQRRDF